jgi:hypothetical protein
MAEQYLRACNLTLSGGGSAIDLSNMRIKFKITHATVQAPNSMTAFIYNLSKDTKQRIMAQKEFSKVTLEAGYEQNTGVIFKGEIIQRITGRENPTDTYLAIVAKEGDQGYNFATVNKTFAKGSTGKDHYDALAQALSEHGIQPGFISDKLAQLKFPRAVSMFGMARDYLRNLSLSTGCTWSIQDGQLDVVHKDETKPGGTIILNSQTGLIGMPIETMNGIYVRCLINPRIKNPINRLVKIDQNSINRAFIDPSYQANAFNRDANDGKTLTELLGTNDGVYKIIAADWSGDTRGTDWYCDLICAGAKTASAAGFVQSANNIVDIGPS